MEQSDGRSGQRHPAPPRGSGDPHESRRLPLLSQLLHLLLLHVDLYMGALAAGDRLDGAPRHQSTAPDHRARRRVEAYAHIRLRLHPRGGRCLHCRAMLSGLVGNEQPRGLGWSQSRLVVCPAGRSGPQDHRARAGTRHRACPSRICRHSAVDLYSPHLHSLSQSGRMVWIRSPRSARSHLGAVCRSGRKLLPASDRCHGIRPLLLDGPLP